MKFQKMLTFLSIMAQCKGYLPRMSLVLDKISIEMPSFKTQWNDKISNGQEILPRLATTNRWLNNEKRSYPTVHYLDLWCGIGKSTQHLYEKIDNQENRPYEIIGMDPNPVHIKIARNQYPYIHFEWGFLNGVKYPSQFFYYIQADGETFLEYKEQTKLLQEISKILETNGKFSLNFVKNRFSVQNVNTKEIQKFFEYEMHEMNKDFVSINFKKNNFFHYIDEIKIK